MDKKLIFPLCLTCAETKLNSNCTHNEDERTFYKKVYCTPELSYAIENGYIVKKIHEIWNFKRMKANSPNNGLFGNFISEAVKGKQEATGFPNGVETPQQKQEFINSYHRATGIQLREENVKKNPGLRFIFKLLANSLWGKFAQRNDRSRVEFVHDYDQLAKLIQDSTQIVKSIIFSKNVAIVSLAPKLTNIPLARNTNVAIASFVTSYGRVKLHKVLAQLNRRVLYFDTDSIIYTTNGTNDPPIGDYLGDLTDEICDEYGPAVKCRAFVSTGSKSYGLKIQLEDGSYEYKVKSKGITLKGEATQVVSFEALKNIVQSRESINVPEKRFRINKLGHGISLHKGTKKLQFTFDKRRIIDDITYFTVPWGYQL